MRDGCPFCDYEGPSEILERWNWWGEASVYAIEPLGPVVEGHVLIIPERHIADAAEEPTVTGTVMMTAARWARTRHESFNLITSVGTAATQSVRHLHVHVVPRHTGDGVILPWAGGNLGTIHGH